MSRRNYMGIPREKIPWAPEIDPATCTGCGACRDFCPNGVFELDKPSGIMKTACPENCVVLCDKCVPFCPTDSIRFPDKEEIKRLVGRLLHDRRETPS